MTSGSATTLIDSINPSTEEHITTFPDTSPADLDTAVSNARAAAREWASTPWAQRAVALRAMAAVIRGAEDELALLDALDSGNPIRAMRRDVRNAATHLEYFAGLASETKGDVLPGDPSRLIYTRREPYGVVARIIPFNHPIQFAAAKAAAPLAAGNAVIVKPAEQTSLSALRLAALLDGTLPPGVLQFVTGYGSTVGAALVRHADIGRVAFTGSVPTGQTIMRDAAEHIKDISLELGGKNPMIVFPDVDVAQAARAAVDGMNFKRSQGQSCGSNSRVFVHADIYSAFVEALIALLTSIVVGDARDESTEMGPLAFRGQYDKVMGYIERGIADGARLVTGGKRPPGRERGYFVEPTVFDNVDMNMRIAREEIFGPVLSVFTWSDVEDVISQANAVPFGLTANIWTNNLSAAHSAAAELEAGYVWVNGNGSRPAGVPFGGFGMSGLGKENSLEELLSYTRVKSVDVSLLGQP